MASGGHYNQNTPLMLHVSVMMPGEEGPGEAAWEAFIGNSMLRKAAPGQPMCAGSGTHLPSAKAGLCAAWLAVAVGAG